MAERVHDTDRDFKRPTRKVATQDMLYKLQSLRRPVSKLILAQLPRPDLKCLPVLHVGWSLQQATTESGSCCCAGVTNATAETFSRIPGHSGYCTSSYVTC